MATKKKNPFGQLPGAGIIANGGWHLPAPNGGTVVAGGVQAPVSTNPVPPAPAVPSIAATTTAPAPAATATTAEPTAPPGGDPVMDQIYYSIVAQNLLKRDSGLRDLKLNDTRDQEDTATSLERLARSRVQTEQSAKTSANKQGLFYSGILGKRLGEVNTDYTDQKGDTESGFTRRQSDRQNQRGDFVRLYGDPSAQNDYGLAGQQLYAEALSRYVALHANDAPTTAATTDSTPVAGTAKPAPFNDRTVGPAPGGQDQAVFNYLKALENQEKQRKILKGARSL